MSNPFSEASKSLSDVNREQKGLPKSDDYPLMGAEYHDDPRTEGAIQDPSELGIEDQKRRILKQMVKKSQNYSANGRTTFSAVEVLATLDHSISGSTAYNRLESMSEEHEPVMFPHPDSGKKVALYDPSRDNRPPGERE